MTVSHQVSIGFQYDGEEMIMVFPAFAYRVHSCFESEFRGKRGLSHGLAWL